MQDTLLLIEGTSWPGGLESGRFEYALLPQPAELLERHLVNMLLADREDHDLLARWAAQGVSSTPGPCGVVARTVPFRGPAGLPEIAAVARAIASGARKTAFETECRSVAEVGPVVAELLVPRAEARTQDAL